MTTVPIKFIGKRLEINAVARQGGSVEVELLDLAGKPIEGFEASEAFGGDDLRHKVVFRGKGDVGALAGKALCLRFHLRNAELYSFAFRN